MKYKVQLFNTIVLSILMMTCFMVSANPILNIQREAYQLYLKGLKEHNLEASKAQLMALKTYPLHRYAEYRLFLQYSDTIKPDDLVAFIKAEPNSAVNLSLIAFFINKWGKAKNFEDLFVLSHAIDTSQFKLTTQDKCYIGQAQMENGDLSSINKIVDDIWLTGKSLPDACDPLITYWQKTAQTDELTLSRLMLALKNNNTSLAVYLSKQLSNNYDALEGALADIHKTPNNLISIIELPPTSETQSISIVLFELLAGRDLAEAIKIMPNLITKQNLSETQTRLIEDAVFKQLLFLNNPTSAQLKLREQFFETTLNDELIENRIRIALRENDWENISKGISRLSQESQNNQTWRYFNAMDLNRRGGADKIDQSNKLLNALSQERGFYPMMAALKLNIPYTLKIVPASGNKERFINDPTIARVAEFLHWQQHGQAVREWIYLVEQTPAEEQPYLARIALDNGWHQLAVQTTITAKLWDNIYERFPLGWLDIFTQQTEGKVVPKSYALAIARQESAWAPEVMSPAGAMGLMQVMPDTAKQVATKNEILTYTESNQLLRPAMNIQIGVQYLHDLLTDYGNNRILATAAYNAGPSRVKFWLNRTGGKVDSAQFIESISFPETRQYVKNVLSFDMYYRLLLQHYGLSTDEVGNVLSKEEQLGKY
ncbi:murein transglycosylase [Thorsellia anophelis]|nr:murein transglycosylase [Thorsellia anophelis]